MELYENIPDDLCVVVYSSKDACVLNTFPSWNIYANRRQVIWMPGITRDLNDEMCMSGYEVWLNPLYSTVFKYEIKGEYYRRFQMPVGSVLLMEYEIGSFRGRELCYQLYHKQEPFFSAMTEKVNKILKDYGCKIVHYSSMPYTTGSVCGDRGD